MGKFQTSLNTGMGLKYLKIKLYIKGSLKKGNTMVKEDLCIEMVLSI